MAREKYKIVHRERGENHLDFSVNRARLCMVRGSSLRVDLPQRLCMERGSSLSVDLEIHEEEEGRGGRSGGGGEGGEQFSVK